MLTIRFVHSVIVAAAIAVFAAQAPAQTNSCLDRTIPVGVFTDDAHAVTTLTAANFKASVDGKPIQVTSATYDTGPRRIVFLMDVSGSMVYGNRIDLGLELIRGMLSRLQPQDSVALMVFSSHIDKTIPFGQNRAVLLTEIDRLQHTDWPLVKGNRSTALDDSLVRALALLAPPRVGDAVVAVTDGGDNASHISESRVARMMISAGVRMYGFLLVVDFNQRGHRPKEINGPEILSDLAAVTGGGFQQLSVGRGDFLYDPAVGIYEPIRKGQGEFREASAGLYDVISGFTKLNVRLPDPLPKPRRWKLEVVDASGHRMKHLHVFHAEKLAACNPGKAD